MRELPKINDQEVMMNGRGFQGHHAPSIFNCPAEGLIFPLADGKSAFNLSVKQCDTNPDCVRSHFLFKCDVLENK